MADTTVMEKLVSLCKRRGFIFPGSEIYGGLNGTWDYGPLGVELLRNVKNAWWNDNVTMRDDIVGLDAAILMHRTVWIASGHESNFTDPLVDDKETKQRYRADQLYGLFPIPAPVDPLFKDIMMQGFVMRTPNGSPRAVPWGVLVAGSLDEAVSQLQQDPKSLVLDRTKAKRLRSVQLRSEDGVGKNLAFVVAEFDGAGTQDAVVTQISLEDLSLFSHLIPSPTSGKTEVLTIPRKFNLMFKTFVGPVEESATQVYLRPETAQGIFVNFKNVCDSSRMKVPFGIAQVGKSFRNEITPKQFIFRSREFEQMEIEFFCKPETSADWYKTWRDTRFKWYQGLGLKGDNLRLREHGKEELAFYSIGTSDIEYKFPWGWGELEGVAHRGDYDLKQHMQHSGKDLSYFDDETKERFVPHVIEPSAGATRSVLAFLCEAYAEEMVEGESRTVLRFHPRIAPVKAAIFPLVKKDGMPERATALYKDLQKSFNVFYDEKGAVGRRYRRQDEAGTPFCITIDGQTNEDQTVTVRERDSMKQERVAVDKVKNYLFEKLTA